MIQDSFFLICLLPLNVDTMRRNSLYKFSNMNSIFNMFGPSPIRPLEQHMHKVHRCAKLLSPFFEAIMANDWQQAEQIQEQIQSLEKDADHMKKELRLHLPSGLFLPVPRTDILELLHYQDSLANKAKDIAGLVIGRKMSIPNQLHTLLPPFLATCLDASRQACKAINELDELLETGFKGREVEVVEEMIVELDNIEHQSDEQLVKVRQVIFELESRLSAVDIIFLYKIVDWIGHIADSAQTIGGRLQILLAR